MMFYMRFPRVTAWVVTLALIGFATLGALQGLRALEPGAPQHMEHMHGIITTMRGTDDFAVRETGHSENVWFHIARGAHVSCAHMLRHLREHAPTDIYYLEQQNGPPLAWIVD